jgi:phospholipid/cholesterol/gamma-HCH transport system ATP-binding protein
MNANAAPALSLRGLHKSFRGKAVLRGLDLDVRPGETFTILGGSGTGKSVCLKHVLGLIRPDAGSVRVFGRDVTHLAEDDLVDVRRDFGMVFQGAALFDSLTVFENVAFPLREHLALEPTELAARVERCLAAVGLPGIEGLLPAELSGGMRKRVGVARAIALEPKAILYDEPTTGLDPANARRIGGLIRRLQERLGVTSVVVTHDLDLCFAVSDRVGLLKGGRIVVEGAAEEVRASRHPDVRAFLGGIQDEGSEPLSGAEGGEDDGP